MSGAKRHILSQVHPLFTSAAAEVVNALGLGADCVRFYFSVGRTGIERTRICNQEQWESFLSNLPTGREPFTVRLHCIGDGPSPPSSVDVEAFGAGTFEDSDVSDKLSETNSTREELMKRDPVCVVCLSDIDGVSCHIVDEYLEESLLGQQVDTTNQTSNRVRMCRNCHALWDEWRIVLVPIDKDDQHCNTFIIRPHPLRIDLAKHYLNRTVTIATKETCPDPRFFLMKSMGAYPIKCPCGHIIRPPNSWTKHLNQHLRKRKQDDLESTAPPGDSGHVYGLSERTPRPLPRVCTCALDADFRKSGTQLFDHVVKEHPNLLYAPQT